jgi:tetratricopeptide (TPR) repeat protein
MLTSAATKEVEPRESAKPGGWRAGVRQHQYAIQRGLLVLLLCFCAYLVFRRGVAALYFRWGAPAAIQAATAWDAANPQYPDVQATALHLYAVHEDLHAIVALDQQATLLSPHDAQLWADLGGAYERAGRDADAFKAFQRAHELFPRSPEINWRLANFCMRTGRIADGIRALRSVLEADSTSRGRVFALATNASSDRRRILEMLPPSAPVFFDYIRFAIARGDLGDGEECWAQLLQLNLPFASQDAVPYLEALIQHQEIGQLQAAWSALRKRFPTQVAPSEPGSNLITNGNFAFDPLNGGLDWHVISSDGVAVTLDRADGADGGRALRIAFDGSRNVDYAHVFQYVPVRPRTKYRFSGRMRTNGISTDSGPRFQIVDAYDLSTILAFTQNIVGTSSWAEQPTEFITGENTRLLLVRVSRPMSLKLDNKVTGTVWIDRINLYVEQ